ncbi:MAG: nitroreductase family protein [Thermodesulfobacteriota bacterium]
MAEYSTEGKEEIDMDLMEAIKGRRSIRKYKPDPIPEDALQKIMEAVRWSPSWANTQCWEVIVVKDPKIKSELATALNKTNPSLSSMTDAPIVIVLCGKKGVSGFKKGEAVTVKGDWVMFDTGIAMQNLCLAAHSLGLGTVIVGRFDHKKAEEILGVPESVVVVAMTPLGYPATEGSTSKRKEPSEFIFYEKYHGTK